MNERTIKNIQVLEVVIWIKSFCIRTIQFCFPLFNFGVCSINWVKKGKALSLLDKRNRYVPSLTLIYNL
jgi:hypothetical protein